MPKRVVSELVDAPIEMSSDMKREVCKHVSDMIWLGIEREHALHTLREASKLLSLRVRVLEQEEK